MKLTINGIEIETQYYIDKWTNWALEETYATDEEVTKNVQWLYKHAELKKPKVIVFRKYENFINYNWDSVRDSVGDSVGDSVRDSVWDSVRASVRASVGDSVWASVWASVRASVGASVRDSVGASVWASVWASVRDSVRDSVGASVRASVGAWYWSNNLSFTDVFIDTKVLSDKKSKELEKIKTILSTQRLAIYTEKICYVLVAPKIHRNEEGKLHNELGLSVDWSGSGLYYLHGVRFEKELWTKIVKGKLSCTDILKLENIEQRMVALKMYDPVRLLIDLKAKIIDKSKRKNELFVIDNKKIFEEPEFCLKYSCPSTGRIYVSFVPPEIGKSGKADKCMAWKHNMSVSQYNNLKVES